MKMLCSGSDLRRLEKARNDLRRAGLACELREDFAASGPSELGLGLPCYPELWLHRDEDYSTAVTLLAATGAIGQPLRR